jgi:hypothetical protein
LTLKLPGRKNGLLAADGCELIRSGRTKRRLEGSFSRVLCFSA